MAQNRRPFAARVLLAASLLVVATAAGAQAAGEVEFARGVGFAQAPGQSPRTLGRGLELKEGDRLTTSEGGSAIINVDRIKELQPLFHGEYVVILRNGTKVTLSRNYREALNQLMGAA